MNEDDWTPVYGLAASLELLQTMNAALTAANDMRRTRINNARRILEPLAGHDKTVDAALAALDGV